MSREEFLRRSENRDECLQDWEDGVAIKFTPAHSRHGYFMGVLFGILRASGVGRVRQETFVDFGARTVGADLAVLFPEHADRLVEGRIRGVPDVIVEIVSQDSVDRDRVAKFDLYYSQGVPWYWIGDPRAALMEEYHHTPEGYVRTASGSLSSPFEPRAIPGLLISVADLLED
jgi:Uma2 family endonuclease